MENLQVSPSLEAPSLNSTAEVETTYPSIYTNRYQAVIFATLSIISGILGITGNTLMLVAVALSKKLQNTTNVFVVSLGISDFITSLTLPFQGVGVLSENGWPLAKGLCDLIGVIMILNISTSILTLAAIAVNRYILITKSKRLYQRIYTCKGTAATVAFLWLLPLLLLVVPQLIPATGELAYDPVFRTCIWDLHHPLVFIFHSSASVIFIICTIIIVFCYVAIYVFIRKHIIAMQKNLQHSQDTLNVENNQATQPSSSGPSVKQINITKNLALVVVVFFVCVVPFSFKLYTPDYKIGTAYLGLILVFPSFLNPLIYAAKHPHFKVVFKCMFSCRYRDIPHPSQCLKAILNLSNVSSSSGQTNTY